jgi:hypothetical protein
MDSEGNQYVTGYFYNFTVIGTESFTSHGWSDIFVAKLDRDGNFLWAHQFGGSERDQGSSIAVDASNNVYLTGYFSTTAAFGDTTLISRGVFDIFVIKLDSDGNVLWAVAAGGTDSDVCTDLAVDTAGVVYLTGRFGGTAEFGAYTLSGNSNWEQLFCATLDSEGSFLGAVSAGGPGGVLGLSISVDASHNAYLTGLIDSGTVTFGQITFTNFSGTFVAKLDTAGDFVWVATVTSSPIIDGYDIAVDSDAFIFLTGGFWGTASFGSTILDSAGFEDIFVAKLDSEGNWLWAVRAGGPGDYETGYGIALDTETNIYVTGRHHGTSEFGSTVLTGGGGMEIFAAKLDTNGNWLWALGAGGPGNEDQGTCIVIDTAGAIWLCGGFQDDAVFGSIIISCAGSLDAFVAKISSEVTVDDMFPPILPDGLYLSAISPNPVYRGQIVSLEAFIAGHESGILTLYNLRGQIISSFHINSGKHHITLDYGSITPGVYLLQLSSQSGYRSKKMVLLN